MAFLFSVKPTVGLYIYSMAALYLGQVFDVIKLVLNKERKGFVKDSQMITAVRIGSWNYFQKELIKYRAGGEIPSTLRPFKKTVTVSLTAGVGAIPSDFIKEVSFTAAGASAPDGGEFLTETSYNERLASLLMPPSLNDPVAKVEGASITVAPTAATSISMQYIRRPADFVYATTVDADAKGTTYSASTSTDMEFSQECYPDIIKEALIWLGVKGQDQAVMALSSTETK